MTYISQGIATEAFGITFRSKLEAAWAYELADRKITWDYVDSPWHDFILSGVCHLEIKPRGMDFLNEALERAWEFHSEWHQETFAVAMGEPREAIWAFCRVLPCGECCSVKLDGREVRGRETFIWNASSNRYTEFAEHRKFHPRVES